MTLQKLSPVVIFLLVVGCGTPNDAGSPAGSGGASLGGAGGQSTAGAGPMDPVGSGGTVGGMGGAAGVGANMSGGAAGASAGAGGSLGGAGAAGAAGSAGFVGGAAGSAGSGGGVGGAAPGGAGGAAGYEPVTGDPFDELPLFEGEPPNFKAGAPAETVNAQGSISNVSTPTLRRFPMDGSKATGFGYIVFPGGAYTGLDFDTHATRLAERVGPLGIAVFGLKYRVGAGSDDAERDALLDAKRAVRLVRHNAVRWGVAVEHVGVVGYSAGSHLALNLAGNFDAGDANASDAVEQQSCRPAFVGSLSTWAFYSPDSPFSFPNDVPPVFFCHAEDDTIAPIALARTVDMQIRAQGAATQLDFYSTGGHSTCHPGDATMEGHDWPDKFWPWLQATVE